MRMCEYGWEIVSACDTEYAIALSLQARPSLISSPNTDTCKNSSEHSKWKFTNSPTFLEVLEEFLSLQVSAGFLLSLLPILKPRFYSISSSQDHTPTEIHLTVAVLMYHTRGPAPQPSCVCVGPGCLRTGPLFSCPLQCQRLPASSPRTPAILASSSGLAQASPSPSVSGSSGSLTPSTRVWLKASQVGGYQGPVPAQEQNRSPTNHSWTSLEGRPPKFASLCGPLWVRTAAFPSPALELGLSLPGVEQEEMLEMAQKGCCLRRPQPIPACLASPRAPLGPSALCPVLGPLGILCGAGAESSRLTPGPSNWGARDPYPAETQWTVCIERVYVQDILQQQLASKVLCVLHKEPGHLYVCRAMCVAWDVAHTLKQLVAAKLNLNEEQVEDYFFQLQSQKHFHDDIFGAVFPYEAKKEGAAVQPSSLEMSALGGPTGGVKAASTELNDAASSALSEVTGPGELEESDIPQPQVLFLTSFPIKPFT
ncbi:nitric oxide synthase, inducible-like [Pongo abelii]|uniref:nitric oxide synthase, inducible-like n=1 Tax=Pongo abelii TaxID=9601 RepID=UPI00300630BF